MLKLDIKAFGLAGGILWSAGVLIMGLLAMGCGYCGKFVAGLGNFYLGYSASVLGSIIGAAGAMLFLVEISGSPKIFSFQDHLYAMILSSLDQRDLGIFSLC